MRKILLIIPLLLSLVSVVRADVVFGNLAAYNNNNGASTNITGGTTTAATLWKGIGFTMGSFSYSLTSVDLRLNNVGGQGVITATTDAPKVSIYTAGSNNRPAVLVGTLNNPTFSSPTPSAVYTFTPAASITLNASTKYILVVQQVTTDGSADTQFDWMMSNPSIAPSGAGASITQAFFDYGTNPTATNGGASTTTYNWFQINGTPSAVPEPSTYVALMGAAALVVAMAVRRRRRSA